MANTPKQSALKFRSFEAMQRAYKAETDYRLCARVDEDYPDGIINILHKDDIDEDGWYSSYAGDAIVEVCVQQSTYCCGLPEVGGWDVGDSVHAPYLARAALLHFGAIKGYAFTTATDHQPGVLKALKETGWKERVALKSNHGDYQIHMFEAKRRMAA